METCPVNVLRTYESVILGVADQVMETIEIPFEDGELSAEDGSDKTQEGSEYPEHEENEITNSSSSNGTHSDHSERNVEEENNNYPMVGGKVPEVRKFIAHRLYHL